MKKLFVITLLAGLMGLSSCGKNNLVNSGGAISGNTGLESSPSAFEGNYDLVESNSSDCAAAIRIVRECKGFKLMSNNMGPEEFCNVNLGEQQTTVANTDPDRAPPPPDRRPPPPPDRRPPGEVNPTSTVVTLEGNQLKSITKVAPGVAFTNTLILNQTKLTKIANLKSRSSRCLFEKR